MRPLRPRTNPASPLIITVRPRAAKSALAMAPEVHLACRPSAMPNRLLCLALALVLSLPAAPALRAQEPARKPPAEETELGKVMEKLNGAWRKLRRQAADPASNAASLELVAVIKAGAEKALAFSPARVEDVPAAGREKFVQDYQRGMKDFLLQVGKLEAAFQAGDNAAAQELVRQIGDLQKEAHKAFKRPDK